MDNENLEKIVNFERYCKKCKYASLKIDEKGVMPEPCDSCLDEPTNINSRKPVKFEAE